MSGQALPLLFCAMCILHAGITAASTSGSAIGQDSGKRFAVLIDAENVNREDMARVLREVATMGDAIIKRAYADWTRRGLEKWARVVSDHGLSTVQIFSTRKKSSSDMMMTVDGIDLLRTNPLITSFAIVSSDSDFTALARRLREAGKEVVGFGTKLKMGSSLVGACTLFRYSENLPGLEESAHDDGMEAHEDGRSTQEQAADHCPPTAPNPTQDDLTLADLSFIDGPASPTRWGQRGDCEGRAATAGSEVQNGDRAEADHVKQLKDAWMVTRDLDGWSGIGMLNEYLQRRNINLPAQFEGKKFSKIVEDCRLFTIGRRKTTLVCRLKGYAAWLAGEQAVWKVRLVDAWEDTKDEEGFANLGRMKQVLLRRHPDFDPRMFRYSRIGEMVEALFAGQMAAGVGGTVQLQLKSACPTPRRGGRRDAEQGSGDEEAPTLSASDGVKNSQLRPAPQDAACSGPKEAEDDGAASADSSLSSGGLSLSFNTVSLR